MKKMLSFRFFPDEKSTLTERKILKGLLLGGIITALLMFSSCTAPTHISPSQPNTDITVSNEKLSLPTGGSGYLVENKIATEASLVQQWQRDPQKSIDVRIMAYSVYDLAPSLDTAYNELLLQKVNTELLVTIAEQQYEKAPSVENEQSLFSLRQDLEAIKNRITEYSQQQSVQKNNGVTEHFLAMGLSCYRLDEKIYVTLNQEQILTLLNTPCIFYSVSPVDSGMDELH